MEKTSPISELTHDISFAVFRVAELVDHLFLRRELERASVELTSDLDEEAIFKLERLIRLGNSIDQINKTNSEVILKELNNLRDLIGKEEEEIEEVDLSDLFDTKEQQLPFKGNEAEAIRKTAKSRQPSKRQKEILEFIRQFPNGCRMGDLARNFSEVSSRTLRNDTTALINSNLVERVGGSRGPYSYLVAAKIPGEDLTDSLAGIDPNVILLSEATTQRFD